MTVSIIACGNRPIKVGLTRCSSNCLRKVCETFDIGHGIVGTFFDKFLLPADASFLWRIKPRLGEDVRWSLR